jgi:transposase
MPFMTKLCEKKGKGGLPPIKWTGLPPIKWTHQKGYILIHTQRGDRSMAQNERRRYGRDFKIEAVQLTQEPGKTIAQVARELNIKAHELYRWCDEVSQHGQDAFPGHGHYRPKDELALLKKENALLREERDILKKSLIFFSKKKAQSLNSSKNIEKSSK